MDDRVLAVVVAGTASLAASCYSTNGTLGLPCESDSECFGEQVCSDAGVCVEAEGGSDGGTGSGSGTSTSSGGDGASGSSGPSDGGTATSSGGDGTGGSSGSSDSGTSDAPILTTILDTEAFDLPPYEQLDRPGIEVGRIHVMVPPDVTWLGLQLTPNNGMDALAVELKDGGSVLASCSVGAGAVCDLGDEIDMAGHNDKVVTAEVSNNDGESLDGLTIEISAATLGMSTSLSVSDTWRGNDGNEVIYTDYVLWPVGEQTGEFSYQWSETATDAYNVGVVNAAGAGFAEANVSEPAMDNWPSSGSPQGFYMMGTSTAWWVADWTFTVDP